MKLVFVYADNNQEWNSSEWRCVIPAAAINSSPDHQASLLSIAEFTDGSAHAADLCESADVILVERNLFGPVLTAIMHWKARGKAVLANFDDAYDLLPENNISHKFWIEGEARVNRDDKVLHEVIDPPPITQFKWGLRMVHGAVVASHMLAEDWKAYTNTAHLPMYLDLDRYKGCVKPETEEIVIGWSGSLSHLHSFSKGVIHALENVCRARPQVRIMVGNDRRIFDRLKVPAHQKTMTAWVPHQEWPQVLASYDIGLAPMEGEFDARRSWVKVLEYMVVKTPWIASRCPAYQELESFGVLVENNPDSWEKALLDMVDRIEHFREKAAGPAYQFALDQGAERNVDTMIGIYTELISRAGLNIPEGSKSFSHA